MHLKPPLRIEVVLGDQTITADQYDAFGERTHRLFADLKEQAVRDALVRLGWTPPDAPPTDVLTTADVRQNLAEKVPDFCRLLGNALGISRDRFFGALRAGGVSKTEAIEAFARVLSAREIQLDHERHKSEFFLKKLAAIEGLVPKGPVTDEAGITWVQTNIDYPKRMAMVREILSRSEQPPTGEKT